MLMSLPRDPAGATKLTASGKSNLKAVSLFFSSFFLTELFVLFLLAPRAHSHTSCLLLHRSPIQAALFHLYELGDYWRLSGNFRNIKKGPSVNECRFACRIAVAFQIIGIWSFFQGIFWRNSKWKLTLITPFFFCVTYPDEMRQLLCLAVVSLPVSPDRSIFRHQSRHTDSVNRPAVWASSQEIRTARNRERSV